MQNIKKNPSSTVDATEQTRFPKSRPHDLEDIGQGQRSSHATHLLMLVIICTKYGKNPSRTVDATQRTWFSRSRPNDLEDKGQGQRSSYATHPLMLMINSMRGCVACDDLWPWPISSRSLGLDLENRVRSVTSTVLDGFATQWRQMDRRADGQTGWIQYTPPNFVAGGIKMQFSTLFDR